jgi:TIR domain
VAGQAQDGVFISYRREDASGHAGRLYDNLVSSIGKDRVFMDVDAIAPGADFVERIDTALSRSRAMFVVIGPRWAQVTNRLGNRRLDEPRDVVRGEVAEALVRGILVIPVLVAGAVMPEEEELPEDVKALATRNAVQLDDVRWVSDVDRLLSAVPATATRAAQTRTHRLSAQAIAPSAFWIAFGSLAAATILGLFLGLVNEKFPSSVGLPLTDTMDMTSGVQIVDDFLFSGINLILGLSLAWLASDDRTARWLAFGMVGTAAAFNVSSHHVFDAAVGTTIFPAGIIHILFHLTVAAGYAYALMLFPDGQLPPIPPGMRSVLAALALLLLAIAFVLYSSSEGWVILYFGVVVVVAGALALFFKARYLPSPFERERASGYLSAYVTGSCLTAAFTAFSLAVQLDLRSAPELQGPEFTHNVVVSLAPILTAIPIVLLVGLIRDRLWGTQDPANRSVLYGFLIVVLLTSFTGVAVVVHTFSTNVLATVLISVLIGLFVVAVIVRPSRVRLMDVLRRKLYGIDPDPDLARRELAERLSANRSRDDAVSALADVTRRSMGVTAGALVVRSSAEAVRSWTWPDEVMDRLLRRVDLVTGEDTIGVVGVQKVTRLGLTKEQRALTRDLATEAAMELLTGGEG